MEGKPAWGLSVRSKIDWVAGLTLQKRWQSHPFGRLRASRTPKSERPVRRGGRGKNLDAGWGEL